MPLLCTARAADFLNLHKSTLEHWRTQGTGPNFVRVGPKIVRYRTEDLDAYLAANVNKETRPSA